MAHIVIIGAGIGGMPAAYELRAKLGAEHRITVVNAVDYFQFVPSNPWLAVGWRDRAGISFPVARYLKRRDIDVHCAAGRQDRRGGQLPDARRRRHRALRLLDHHDRAEARLR